MFKTITICSGIGAPEVAGFNAVAQSEIDSHANSVLRHHYPTAPNLGDIVTANWQEWDADLLVGGTPCQAFSLAGNRQSLKDERSNLALKFCEIYETVNAGLAVWENVPGVLSTPDNAFGCLLGKLLGANAPLLPSRKTGRWSKSGLVFGRTGSAAWIIKDAQHFGVPQRRKRVFVIAFSFRNGERLFGKKPNQDWRRLAGIPAAILFEPESQGRDFKEGEKARGEVAEDAGICAFGSTQFGGFSEGVGTLMAGNEKIVNSSINLICFTAKDSGQDAGIIAPTLRSGNHKNSNHGGGVMPAIACIKDIWNIANERHNGISETGAFTLDTRGNSGIVTWQRPETIYRFTPTECLRLQGFPDNYLDILHNDKPLADGTKYRLIGNSMAVPVMSWIRERIEKVVEEINNANL